ncbi:MAG: hypothetical protein LAO20_17805, partial [Acidobacteriia bacterium]|nr:hypothetical protein [Terriglobia bacterium]
MARNMALSCILRRISGQTVAGIILLALCSTTWGQPSIPCLPAPTPSVSSSTLPTEALPCQHNGITQFDDFSWRSFIALIWPAAKGQRGVPDPTQTNFPVSGPLVFETYKADWETFPPPSSPNPPPAPAPWTSFAGTTNPCGASVNVGWGDVVLASDTKFGNLGLAGFGNFFVGPVISSGFAQSTAQQHYLRYQASYNQTEYNQILNNQWYLQANLGNVTFCSNGATVGGQTCPAENSVDLKSSWMDMDGIPANLQSRYYTKQAWVLDTTSGKCTQRTMGLVGLHIVSKTPARPQWIWSTFEQIDNVPVVTGATPTSNTAFNLNDGNASNTMPISDPYCVPGQPGNPNGCPGTPPPPAAMPADASQATRFNVTRTQPIGIGYPPGKPDETTPATNANYQALLAKVAPASPWQYYQLVMTQWPVPGNTPANPGFTKFSFPGTIPNLSCVKGVPGAYSQGCSFANVTMETFDQTSVTSGCMSCHNLTAHPNGPGSPGND